MSPKSFVVIPVFNEARHIESVVEAARAANPVLIERECVIVVDNNSTDNTAILAAAAGAEVIACERQGKGWAMQAGVDRVRYYGGSIVTFFDGDLRGLTPQHINKLAIPVLKEDSVMNIGYLGARKDLSKLVLKHWGAFSGQRTISIPEVWDYLQPSDLRGWRTEGAMNAVCRNKGQGHLIERTELADLRHTGQSDKQPSLYAATTKYIEIYKDAIQGLRSQSGKR